MNPIVWNSEWNARRFELIDSETQRTLSQAEQIELADLTQLMREHVDSELNVPIRGARQLHALLTGLNPELTDSEQ